MRFYGIDVRGLFTGDLSPRFCIALIEHLPIESAFKTALMCDGGHRDFGWDRNTYMLAEVVDSLQALSAAFIRSKVKNPKSVKQPKPYLRPGQQQKRAVSDNQFARALDESVALPGTKTFAIPKAVLDRSTSSDTHKGGDEPTPFVVK
ncbi:hypothetical protein ACFY0N_30760 [Streptomyces vinaceus]|uniref:hypothetical protein n=1 Tax=Streptomyces vinaceus TaxID=1960 RepID=UPI0036B667C2